MHGSICQLPLCLTWTPKVCGITAFYGYWVSESCRWSWSSNSLWSSWSLCGDLCWQSISVPISVSSVSLSVIVNIVIEFLYTYISITIYIQAYIAICAYMHMHMHGYAYAYACAYVYLSMYKDMYTYTYNACPDIRHIPMKQGRQRWCSNDLV